MDIAELIKVLSQEDDLEKWNGLVVGTSGEDVKKVFSEAEKGWVRRKLDDGSLLVHPKVKDEIVSREYELLPRHRKMVWANVLASYDGVDSKARFNVTKENIIRKYGNQWWFDVYKRTKTVYAVKEILKNSCEGAVGFAAKRSTVFGMAVEEERIRALEMLPKQ